MYYILSCSHKLFFSLISNLKKKKKKILKLINLSNFFFFFKFTNNDWKKLMIEFFLLRFFKIQMQMIYIQSWNNSTKFIKFSFFFLFYYVFLFVLFYYIIVLLEITFGINFIKVNEGSITLNIYKMFQSKMTTDTWISDVEQYGYQHKIHKIR